MKNFKKVLALVLAVVMALSLVTMSSAAFTDDASITKDEAVAVLSAIGVIKGNPDGSFKPEGTVTRAEMAKMIAVLLNSGEDVGPLYAGACSFADSASHWAAGYIAFCAQEGIINGRNASTFDPEGKVTGTEAAKMVLAAMGHTAEAIGTTGASWASKTMNKAKEYDLVGSENNMTANMAEALTRENAAQMLLNALNGNATEYKIVKGRDNGVEYIQSTEEIVTARQSMYRKYFGVDNGNLTKVTQVIDHYDDNGTPGDPSDDVPVYKAKTDEYGRTVNTWSYDGELIGNYSVAPYIVYTGEVTMGQLYTDLGKVAGNNLNSVSYHIDGYYNIGSSLKFANATAMKNALAAGNVATTIGGIGVTTEVYFDEVDKTLNIVEIRTHAARVYDVVAAVKDVHGDVVTDGYVVLKDLDGTTPLGYATATYSDGTPIGVADSFVTEAFTQADKANKTFVAYTKGYDGSNYVITSVAPATVVTGVNKGAGKVAGTVVDINIDGTTYEVNAAVSGVILDGTYGETETLYLDANGYIIASTGNTVLNYALVLGAWEKQDSSKPVVMAEILLSDGSVKQIVVEQNVNTTLYPDAKTSKTDVNALNVVKYVVSADGEYILEPVNGASPTLTADKVVSQAPYLKNDNSVKADKNTVFVFGDKDSTGKEFFTVYTGIANVPTLDVTPELVDDNGNSDPADDVYSVISSAIYYVPSTTDSSVAAYVFVKDVVFEAATTDKFGALYITGEERTQVGENGTSYTDVAAIVDGEVTTLRLDGATYNAINTAVSGYGFYLFSATATNAVTGYYDTFTRVTSTASNVFDVTAADFAEYKGGLITIGSTAADTVYVDADTVVFVYNKDTKKVEKKVITDITTALVTKANEAGYMTRELVNTNVGAVNALYLVIER